jgi:dimeric dUTPase (all-alpha-NTP-PPase superfamily)
MLSLKQGAQLINSLKGSKKKVGLLINFGELSLKFKRFVYWNGSNNRNNHITNDIQQILESLQ